MWCCWCWGIWEEDEEEEECMLNPVSGRTESNNPRFIMPGLSNCGWDGRWWWWGGGQRVVLVWDDPKGSSLLSRCIWSAAVAVHVPGDGSKAMAWWPLLSNKVEVETKGLCCCCWSPAIAAAPGLSLLLWWSKPLLPWGAAAARIRFPADECCCAAAAAAASVLMSRVVELCLVRLFLRQPPPTGTLRKVPPAVQ